MLGTPVCDVAGLTDGIGVGPSLRQHVAGHSRRTSLPAGVFASHWARLLKHWGGFRSGTQDGELDGRDDDGALDGEDVDGDAVGDVVGGGVGPIVGARVGNTVGGKVGEAVGTGVGLDVGPGNGDSVGD